jgi:predicted DNA binding CopG/RHH family protein
MTTNYENIAADEWENGTFGQSDEHVKRSELTLNQVDDALGMQSISIRMPRELLEDIKQIASLNGIGYQPLIKQVLNRFVNCELKKMLRDQAQKLEARQLAEQTTENSQNDTPKRKRA